MLRTPDLQIDYVSPLPPVRSGIADYSADLLPELSRHADVRLVHLKGQPLEASLAARFEVVSPERLGEGGRLPLYQMGNNQYHVSVHELAMAHPGVLVLHDVVLHHFLLDQTYNQGSFEAYRDGLRAEHGWIGAAAALPLRWPGGIGDAAQFSLPAHGRLLGRQHGVLVHSQRALDWIQEELGEVRARVVPMGIPLPAPAESAAAVTLRRRYDIPEDRPLLGTFGFQTPIKRTDVAIRALASPALRDVWLMVAGEVPELYDLERKAREAGVEERVRFLGYLPFEEFSAAIAATDVCLNLRYPTAGETSASLLRTLAIGRPAVVSDYGQAAELSDEIVLKVPLGDGEEEALAAGLAELLAEPGRLAEMGRVARQYVETQHAPSAAGEAVAEACAAWCERAPMSLSPAPVPPPTSLTWREIKGAFEVSGVEAPWKPGERRRLEIRLENQGQARWLASERHEGGLSFEVQVLVEGRDLLHEKPWLRLPVDLEPGQSYIFQFELRRPLPPARLRLVPHLLGDSGSLDLRSLIWEADL